MEKNEGKQKQHKKNAAARQKSGRSRERPAAKSGAPLSPGALRGQKIRIERRRRRLKKLLRRTLTAFAVLAVLALIFVFGFRLKNINVTGNSRYTKEEILNLIQYDDQYHNTVIFYLQHRNMEVDGIPFLDGIHMDIGSAGTINIEVVEKIVAGCIKDGSRYIYIDTDGIVGEIGDTRQNGVPLIEGLEYEAPQLNQMLNVTDTNVYNILLNLTLLLEKYEIDVEAIRFAGDSTVSLSMGDVLVMLGRGDYMEDKITELYDLLSELSGRKGTLHLENYEPSTENIIFSSD